VTGFRLPKGGAIDRRKPVRFRFDGQEMQGFAGDTLASALLASGIRVVGRSFKYHRPRGVMSAGPEEGGALLTLGSGAERTANIKASMLALEPGMELFSQNCWPSRDFDLGAVNDLLHPFIGAGFYYKTFMGPLADTRFWMFCEKFIRRAAGMGQAASMPDPDCYDIAHDFCDLLVVGSGPAGLLAAAEAAEKGYSVLIAEQDHQPGGSLLNSGNPADRRQIQALRTRIEQAGGRLLCQTTAFGLFDHLTTGLLQRHPVSGRQENQPRETLHIIRPAHILLASGAGERGFVFADNDRPGVMTSRAVATYQGRFGVAAGQQIVLAGTHDGVYGDALQLAAAGLSVTLLDSRAAPSPLSEQAEAANIRVLLGRVPCRVVGRSRVAGLETARHLGAGQVERDHHLLGAEIIASSAGFVPNIQLLSMRGIKPVWQEKIASFVAGPHDLAVSVAGAAAGCFEDQAMLASVERFLRKLQGQKAGRPPRIGFARAADSLFEVRLPGKAGRAFLDPQHDVTSKDVRQAVQEGYLSVEHIKRYTTLGMATDQGRNGNINGLAVIAEARGISISQAGITGFRPPVTPVSIGALAGRRAAAHFRPLRRTPMHDLHLANRAVMTDAGLWQRAWYYPQAGQDLEAASVAEALRTRQIAGICDVSTLGKIQVQGPDAAEFLNRLYVNNMARLAIGKARYGVMLRDDGMVFDDGTVMRLAEDDFLVSTTTAKAGPVMQFMEELLQLRWPDMQVCVTSVSDAWAAVSIAGPAAAEILAELAPETDFGPDGFAFMAVKQLQLSLPGGPVPALIARISFSGEKAFEVWVGAGFGPALWSAMAAATQAAGGLCYGLEALGIMRIEKGHVTGAELDGRVTLEDAGLGRMASASKPFIGSVLRQRPAMMDKDRAQLVGIFPKNRAARFSAGAVLCAPDEVSGHGTGWVTAVAHSPVLGHWIGLGFIAGGAAAWQDKSAIIADPVRGQQMEVEIVSPHMVDPDGERMRDRIEAAQ
jgi:heterotetrameric sarcosine oxidase alpha subunit